MNIMKIILILIENSAQIKEQVDQLILFFQWLLEKFQTQDGKLGAGQMEEVAIEFPLIAQLCEEIDDDHAGKMSVAGPFQGFLKRLIETLDPETIKQYIEIFKLIRDMIKPVV